MLVRGYLAAHGFSAGKRDEAVLAVDEACANSVRHSYASRGVGRIELSLSSAGDYIEIVVRDYGIPADHERIAKDVPEKPDPADLKPGGLGLTLMRRVFDEVDFRPGRESGNCVTMRLKRS